MDRCAECGFDYDALAVADIPATLRSLAEPYATHLLDTDVHRLRAHPVDGVWSALEYGCHVRDVLQVQRQRIDLILAEDCPTLTPMGRDDRVTRDHYNDQDPRAVADDLRAAANELAAAFDALSPEEWQRTAIYNYPTTQERSLVWIARNAAHEGRHHLMDIDRLLSAAPDG